PCSAWHRPWHSSPCSRICSGPELDGRPAATMLCLALSADYDGTLARHGRVEDETVRALERLRATGRKLILVTGRELDDLLAIFPAFALSDLVVAENGGVLFDPATKTAEPLPPAPPRPFVDQLRA